MIKTTGPISLSDIIAEFGGTSPVQLSHYYRGGALVPDTAQNSKVPTAGAIALSMFYGADSRTPTFQKYTSADTFSFVVPNNVNSINYVVIGAGGGGGGGDHSDGDSAPGAGGGSGYIGSGSFAVTPGETLTVITGAGGVGGSSGYFTAGGAGGNGGATIIKRGNTVLAAANGGNGGAGANAYNFGNAYYKSGVPGAVGGAGGYTGGDGGPGIQLYQGGRDVTYSAGNGAGVGGAPVHNVSGGAGLNGFVGGAQTQNREPSSGWFQNSGAGGGGYFANGNSAGYGAGGAGGGGGGGSLGGTGGRGGDGGVVFTWHYAGNRTFLAAGTFSFVVPDYITQITFDITGGGGGGGGGGADQGYPNDGIRQGLYGSAGGTTAIYRGGTLLLAAGGGGGGAGNAGASNGGTPLPGTASYWAAGGAAGGYPGSSAYATAGAGQYGSGGGGGSACWNTGSNHYAGGGGGAGGRVVQTLAVTPGETLTIIIGSGGAGGWGNRHRESNAYPDASTINGTYTYDPQSDTTVFTPGNPTDYSTYSDGTDGGRGGDGYGYLSWG